MALATSISRILLIALVAISFSVWVAAVPYVESSDETPQVAEQTSHPQSVPKSEPVATPKEQSTVPPKVEPVMVSEPEAVEKVTPAPKPAPEPKPAPKPKPQPAPKAEPTPKVNVAPKVKPKPKAASKPKPKAAPSKKKNTIKLFGTVEFKGKIHKLPMWTRVMNKMNAWEGYFKATKKAKLPSNSGWRKLKKDATPLDRMGRVKAVNKFFNQWPYRLDPANYGKRDYWATPMEFLRKSGDCEDYAIAKYYGLKEFGFTKEEMRIVALKDVIRNLGHAVLVVYLNGEAYVLDNQTNMVLPHSRYKHYLPWYSVNESYRWMHVPVKKKKK